MSFMTMDVSPGELAAICDYSNKLGCRSPCDFMCTPGISCLLCGTVDTTRTQASLRHLTSPPHVTRVALYNNCYQSLLVHERCALEKSMSGVSRREVVLMYLSDRLARADVIRGVGTYNTAAVNYLLHRSSTPELINTFSEVTASEYSPTRGLCTICLSRPSSMMFEECQHVCTCTTCVGKLRAVADDHAEIACPICRALGNPVSVFIS